MNNLGNSVVDLDCNVNIKVLDKNGNVVRDSSVHNKATVNMIDSILRFMKGDFTRVAYSSSSAPDDGTPFIPTQVRFGRIGVKLKENEINSKPNFDRVDRSEFVQTVFNTTSLQEPCFGKFEEVEDGDPIYFRFDKIRQTGYSDTNNAECLEFSAYITPGTLVGKTLVVRDPDNPNKSKKIFKPYHYSYWNPNINEYEAMITEISLTSDYGVLLARVLFDGQVGQGVVNDPDGSSVGTYPILEDPNGEFTPITQSQTSTVVVTWRIGIISVGKNDKVVTENDLDVYLLSRELASLVLEEYHVESVDGESVSYSKLSDSLEEMVNKILNGKIVSEMDGGSFNV